MTTIQLNAALMRELNVIMTDEGMMKKAIKALRRITSKQKTNVTSETVENASEQLELPDSFKQLRGAASITEEDIKSDGRIAYIMGK